MEDISITIDNIDISTLDDGIIIEQTSDFYVDSINLHNIETIDKVIEALKLCRDHKAKQIEASK